MNNNKGVAFIERIDNDSYNVKVDYLVEDLADKEVHLTFSHKDTRWIYIPRQNRLFTDGVEYKHITNLVFNA